MTRMLVVSSPSLSPLSTAVPLPTDGHDKRCIYCHVVEMPGLTSRQCHSNVRPTGEPGLHVWSRAPLTVAVWQEASGYDEGHGPECCTPSVGAVVATVEVTDRGHHASDPSCEQEQPGTDGLAFRQLCGGSPLGWHTPTSTVTRLDVPIPHERPVETHEVTELGAADTVRHIQVNPASFWFADLDLEVPA